MDERQKRGSQFVVSSGDAPEVFDASEEAFDPIAVFVELAIEGSLNPPIGTRWDNGLRTRRFDFCNEVIGIVAFVGDDGLCRQVLDGFGRTVDVGNLTRRENDPQWFAQGIDHHMQFGRQSAPRATDFLTAGFFWAPAECWWARTMVESMNRCSISASLRRAWATRSNTPFSRQRENRTYVRCQCPNSAGKSRQGLPVRMTQRMASTKRRLSFAVTPRSLALPGSNCSIRSHCSSRSIFRSILTPPKSQDMTIFHPM